MRGQLDFAVFLLVCIGVIGVIGVFQALSILFDVVIIQDTLDVYIYLDDESSSLVSLMGAQRSGMLYMEMIGYKVIPDCTYNVPEMGEIERTMALMENRFSLCLLYTSDAADE